MRNKQEEEGEQDLPIGAGNDFFGLLDFGDSGCPQIFEFFIAHALSLSGTHDAFEFGLFDFRFGRFAAFKFGVLLTELFDGAFFDGVDFAGFGAVGLTAGCERDDTAEA